MGDTLPVTENEPSQATPLRPELLMTPFLLQTDMAVSYADPSAPDAPLIHVNDAFCKLTGYTREETVGKNCRFLQGKLTRAAEVAAIRTGIEQDYYLITRLLNYRKNRDVFDNILQLGQVRDTRGHTLFLFGLQWDVTRSQYLLGGSSLQADLQNRVLTPQLKMLEHLANHLARRSLQLGVGAAGIPLVERLAAMSRPFQFPTTGPDRNRATLRALLDYLLLPYRAVEGSRLRINGVEGTFDVNICGPLALWLHELASASLQNGALSKSTGLVILSWGYLNEQGRPKIAFHWHEMNNAHLPGANEFDPWAPINTTGGMGARVVDDVVQYAGGRSVRREWGDNLDATVVLANDS